MQKALQELPQHRPPDDCWMGIAALLDSEISKDSVLRNSLSKLPEYPAPEIIWDRIVADLPKVKKDTQIFTLLRMASAASFIGIIVIFGIIYNSNKPTGDSIAYSYSTEQFVPDNPTFLGVGAMKAEQDAFAKVKEICQAQPLVCEQPHVQALQSELDELDQATSSIKEVLGEFDDEPELRQQLLQLEQEKAEVLKKIIAEI
ncbi:MAG: hypothetical protein ACOYOA_04705 [Saprospiraceae bacterium]